MANNKSLQVLRGSTANVNKIIHPDKDNVESELLPGQILFNKDTRELYVGGAWAKPDASNTKLPIKAQDCNYYPVTSVNGATGDVTIKAATPVELGTVYGKITIDNNTGGEIYIGYSENNLNLQNSVGIGNNCITREDVSGTIFLGNNNVPGDGSIIVGNNITCEHGNIILKAPNGGDTFSITGNNNIIISKSIDSEGEISCNDIIIIGNPNITPSAVPIFIGNGIGDRQAKLTTQIPSIVLGNNIRCDTFYKGICIGTSIDSNSNQSIIIGHNSLINGAYSATESNSIIIGNDSRALGRNTGVIIIGGNAEINDNLQSIAIGNYARVKVNNDIPVVQLGNNSNIYDLNIGNRNYTATIQTILTRLNLDWIANSVTN